MYGVARGRNDRSEGRGAAASAVLCGNEAAAGTFLSRIDVKTLVATVMALNLLPAHSTVAAQLRTDNPAGDVCGSRSAAAIEANGEAVAVWQRTAGGQFCLTRNWLPSTAWLGIDSRSSAERNGVRCACEIS